MFVYWLMLVYFALGAILSGSPQPWQERRPNPFLACGAIMIALLIGLRYEVGADWQTYKFMFSYAGYANLGQQLKLGDPGYQFLNWLVRRIGYEIWLVNFICGAIFSWGLLRFAKVQTNPWLALVVAIPYLVIVVAMGYTRQAVAIGILMAGLASLARGGSIFRFAAYVAVAALFHKTAVVAMPLVLVSGQRNRMINILIGAAVSVLLYDVFLSESVEGLVRNYVETKYSSGGAAVRVAMCAVPAVIYLAFHKRFAFPSYEAKIWRNYALAAIALVIALALSPSSTVVDRIALYILPLQLAVLSALPRAFPGSGIMKATVIIFAFMVQFVWLNFATFSSAWVPYHFYPV